MNFVTSCFYYSDLLSRDLICELVDLLSAISSSKFSIVAFDACLTIVDFSNQYDLDIACSRSSLSSLSAEFLSKFLHDCILSLQLEYLSKNDIYAIDIDDLSRKYAMKLEQTVNESKASKTVPDVDEELAEIDRLLNCIGKSIVYLALVDENLDYNRLNAIVRSAYLTLVLLDSFMKKCNLSRSIQAIDLKVAEEAGFDIFKHEGNGTAKYVILSLKARDCMYCMTSDYSLMKSKDNATVMLKASV